MLKRFASRAFSLPGFHASTKLFRQRQREEKNRAAPGFAAHGNFPAVVFDDFFADRKTQAGAVRFPMRGERLEKPADNLRCNAGSGVLDFSGDFAVVELEAQQ